MTITNGYATLQEFKQHRSIVSANKDEDDAIERIITDASRMIDGICGRWFYAYTQTRYLSFPYRETTRALDLGEDCLTLTSVTNGDGTTISASDYILDPRNHPVKTRIVLKRGTTTIWQSDSTTGNTECVIALAGTWGYCDRAATDPYSAAVIGNTRSACLEIASQMFLERAGQNTGGQVQVTGAGVVITPHGAVPKSAYDRIKPYIKLTMAASDDQIGYGW